MKAKDEAQANAAGEAAGEAAMAEDIAEEEAMKKENAEKILVSLNRYEDLVLLVELLFNVINDRMPLGTMSNEFLMKLEKLKEEINEAKA